MTNKKPNLAALPTEILILIFEPLLTTDKGSVLSLDVFKSMPSRKYLHGNALFTVNKRFFDICIEFIRKQRVHLPDYRCWKYNHPILAHCRHLTVTIRDPSLYHYKELAESLKQAAGLETLRFRFERFFFPYHKRNKEEHRILSVSRYLATMASVRASVSFTWVGSCISEVSDGFKEALSKIDGGKEDRDACWALEVDHLADMMKKLVIK